MAWTEVLTLALCLCDLGPDSQPSESQIPHLEIAMEVPHQLGAVVLNLPNAVTL